MNTLRSDPHVAEDEEALPESVARGFAPITRLGWVLAGVSILVLLTRIAREPMVVRKMPDRVIPWLGSSRESEQGAGLLTPRDAAGWHWRTAWSVQEAVTLEAAIPGLLTMLSHKDSVVRNRAVEGLACIAYRLPNSPPLRSAVRPLIRSLNEENLDTRECAAKALSRMVVAEGTTPEVSALLSRSVPTLVKSLGEEHRNLRAAAAWMLRVLAENAGTQRAVLEAVAPLTKALEDVDPNVRVHATDALIHVVQIMPAGPVRRHVLQGLQEVMRGDSIPAAKVRVRRALDRLHEGARQ